MCYIDSLHLWDQVDIQSQAFPRTKYNILKNLWDIEMVNSNTSSFKSIFPNYNGEKENIVGFNKWVKHIYHSII